MGEIKTDTQLILEELRALRAEMSDFRSTIQQLTAEINHNKQCIEGLTSRVETLEQRQNKIIPITETPNLQETISELKQNLNDRDQELLQNDIEIAGIPEEKNENAAHIMLTVANKLGVSIDERDIVNAERGGPLRAGSSHETPDARPRVLIIRLTRRALRGQLLAAARVRRSLQTDGLGLSGSPKNFYINERLTKQNRHLFYNAREAARREKWHYVWTRDGRIYARREQGAPRHRIKSEADINRVFGCGGVRT
ncbi:uncharacterized protein LOC114366413 [Ostrinia furnacalis]|uniref:uncharacterized protein LOC114366413 n=1 Tax=Ostrinia furnacalis TaxID=93504 RepID=UPI001038640A|nr:uncharacterized protein LOC114366413 [Ostrinia furnacalis]